MKLLRTLRLDPSDTFVFARAAEPGEWAVPGSGFFVGVELDELAPKDRAAFRSGFLGTESLGFSTLVEVAKITPDEAKLLVGRFAHRLRAEFGAPSVAAAEEAAREEIALSESLAAHPPGTVIAMRRSLEDGAIREQFRTLNRRAERQAGADGLHAYARAFEFIEVEEPEERVDLLGLHGRLDA
jgi:hypothetical protein